MKKEGVDWAKFNDRYVRLVTGIEKRLKLTKWSDGVWFERPGIGFEVLEEDGVRTPLKELTVTSRKLIRALKPIILKAEQEERSTITVSIVKSGEGLNTGYVVKDLSLSKDKHSLNEKR